MLRRLSYFALSGIAGGAALGTLADYRSQKRIEAAKALSNNDVEIVAARVIQQAFTDIGYRGKVSVRYQLGYPLGFTTATSIYKNESVVTVTYGTLSQLSNLKEIYAIAGHESVHALQRIGIKIKAFDGFALSTVLYVTSRVAFDLAKKSQLTTKNVAAIYTGAIIYTACMSLLGNAIMRRHEKEADILSAQRLKTGKVQAESLKTVENADILNRLKTSHETDLRDSHYSHRDRLRYLSVFATQEQPAYFESREFRQLEGEMRKAQKK